MASGDITFAVPNLASHVGARKANVAAAATAILAGEPITQALGGTTVTAMLTNLPVVGTNFLA